jgi:hypothetical protein
LVFERAVLGELDVSGGGDEVTEIGLMGYEKVEVVLGY